MQQPLAMPPRPPAPQRQPAQPPYPPPYPPQWYPPQQPPQQPQHPWPPQAPPVPPQQHAQHQYPQQYPQPPVRVPQPPPLPRGTVLVQRYLIEDYIGGGGFAHIYRARDLPFGHRRAVKEAFYYDPLTREQFRYEAEFLINAQHPNLVRGYAYFEHAGRLYLVMDYVHGQTLEDIAIDYIRRTGRALPEAQVLDWMIPIADAAHTLHTQPVPIIHRDVKPANIKLSRDKGIPILMDLGLAKLNANGTKTIAAALAFTPGYAPPEQYQAAGRTDQRTDVYGLGASLFFLLTGYQPTEAPARLGPRQQPAPRALNPALSAYMDAVVQRAMALDPRQRQPSAAVLAAELRAARAALGPLVVAAGSATSGGPIPAEALRACPRCAAMNPAQARFCMGCGGPLAPEDERREGAPAAAVNGATHPEMPIVRLDAEPPPAEEGVASDPAMSAAVAAVPELPSPPSPPAILSPIPEVPSEHLTGAALFAPDPNALAAGRPALRMELEATASVLAVLALVAVSLSLAGAFIWPMRFFAPLGIALAHRVVGLPFAHLLARSGRDQRIQHIADWAQRRPWARWALWRALPAPREFRLLARITLVAGYLWLALLFILWLWSLFFARL